MGSAAVPTTTLPGEECEGPPTMRRTTLSLSSFARLGLVCRTIPNHLRAAERKRCGPQVCIGEFVGEATKWNLNSVPEREPKNLTPLAVPSILSLSNPGRYDAVVSTADFNLGLASWLPQAVLTTAEYRPG